jgi:hypothetical protein
MDELGVLGHPVEISLGQAGGERVARAEQPCRSAAACQQSTVVMPEASPTAVAPGSRVICLVDHVTTWSGRVERTEHGRHPTRAFEGVRQVTTVLELSRAPRRDA